jgi:hypothetical protein
MLSKIKLITGITLLGAGILVIIIIGKDHSENQAFFDWSVLIFYGLGGGLAVTGLVLSLVGLSGIVKGAKLSKLNAHIAQTGFETEGTVTFVDKNYSILIT